MGSQFTSRWTGRQSAQVVSRISAVRNASIEGKKGGVDDLTAKQRRELGDSMLAEIISIAEQRKFGGEFEASQVFVETLDWLKWLHTDAQWNGCRKSVARYRLDEHSRPIPVLVRALRKIASAESYPRDRFRVASSEAARGVLAAVATRIPAGASAGAESERFCRALADFDLEEFVATYIRLFVNALLARILGLADPQHLDPAIEDARRLGEATARRVGRRVVARVKKKGALTDSNRIHDLLLELFRELAKKGGE